MGCLGSFGTNQYSSSQDNWFNYQGTYAATPQMINECNRRQKIRLEQAAAENKKKIKDEIEDFLNKTVDPKLFVFDPNFFKDCDNIQKIKYDDSEYEGQMKDGKKHGKGILAFIVELRIKENIKKEKCMEKEYINTEVVQYIMENLRKIN